MATLREIRRRITSVKSTQKITKAMKMVAAAKLRRAQDAVISARPYSKKIKEVFSHLGGTVDVETHPLFAERQVNSVAIIVVTADRGLCGAFN
jgi:F-type H+-transporting ATPase subunit gamma